MTQQYTHDIDNKQVVVNHPITYVSGLFKGSQLNWAALTKEAYAIYMSIKKLTCVLTQQYTHDIDNKQVVVNHPITYVSGLFKGSQLNWAALTKEAYAIYMSIKKLTYYLEDAEITLEE